MRTGKLTLSIASVCVLVAFALHPAPGTDLVLKRVTTFHNNLSRQGVNTDETVLRPANVNSREFGKLFSQPVDGFIYAQPLFLTGVYIPGKGIHNVVFAATEHGTVYAFDADDNAGGHAAPLWKRSFSNPALGVAAASSNDVGCGDIVPEVGISGTPVIDTASRTLYLVTKTRERGRFVQRLHALDIETGAEKLNGPVEIKAAVRGTGIAAKEELVTFDALREHQRAGLLLQNGLVYVAWASHCDNPPYHGWVMTYDARTLRQTAVWNATPDGQMGGIWQSGAAPAGDGEYAYVTTGNGDFDVHRGGRNFGDSILKLAVAPQGTLAVADYFTPYDQASLNAGDIEPGSGGTVLISIQGGRKHYVVNVSKSGTIYVVDPANMGHFNPEGNYGVVQSIPAAAGGVWGTPAWWSETLYVAGSYDRLKAFRFDSGAGRLVETPSSQSKIVFTYPGPTPAVSSNGRRDGIVWVVQAEAYVDGGSAVLRAFDARDLARELYNSAEAVSRDDPGRAVKFSVPTVVNGKVYVAAQDRVSVYGLLRQP
jgi:hypothetical protein